MIICIHVHTYFTLIKYGLKKKIKSFTSFKILQKFDLKKLKFLSYITKFYNINVEKKYAT